MARRKSCVNRADRQEIAAMRHSHGRRRHQWHHISRSGCPDFRELFLSLHRRNIGGCNCRSGDRGGRISTAGNRQRRWIPTCRKRTSCIGQQSPGRPLQIVSPVHSRLSHGPKPRHRRHATDDGAAVAPDRPGRVANEVCENSLGRNSKSGCLPPSAAVTLAGLAMVWTLAAEGHGLMALTAAIATLALAIGVASVVLAILLLWRWLPAMARNGFGICTGLSSPNSAAGFLGLTPWMHETIQKAAGRTVADKPLTFGDLWGAGKGLPAADPKAARAIELSMITSDVSRQRSAQFPFIQSRTTKIGARMWKRKALCSKGVFPHHTA